MQIKDSPQYLHLSPRVRSQGTPTEAETYKHIYADDMTELGSDHWSLFFAKALFCNRRLLVNDHKTTRPSWSWLPRTGALAH